MDQEKVSSKLLSKNNSKAKLHVSMSKYNFSAMCQPFYFFLLIIFKYVEESVEKNLTWESLAN